MEERRLLLAVALSLVLLTTYQVLMPAPPARRAPTPAPAPAGTSAAPASAGQGQAPTAVEPPAPPTAPVAVAAVADAEERRVEGSSEDLEIAFTNRGARLLSWKLLRYVDGRGRAEEMVQVQPGTTLRPFDVETGDAALDTRLREALFRPSAEMVRAQGDPATLRFEFSDGDLEATKIVEIPPSGYLARVSVSVRRGGREIPKRIVWGPGIANPTDEERKVQGYLDAQAVAYDPAEGVERREASSLGEPWSLPSAEWAGVDAMYFAALWVPPGGRGAVSLTGVAPREGDKPTAAVAAVDLGTGTEPALLYVGPKDHSILKKQGHRLADVVDVGEWIGPIVIALSGILRRVNATLGNYGWSIVALTVVINLLMAPLRHYSIVNGLKMAKLAPEMRVIQDRYKKVPALDPKRQEMQREIGELYARHGMSMGTQMLVGCLPLLITMPFLIAFYRVLSVSIELRGAQWLWIPDLSQRDPWFLIPLLMGVSMFVMQKLTPTAMDPAQQRVMLIMPVVFTAMFFAAPAGLNLYWMASNVCSIVQQGLTLSLLKDHLPREKK